MKQRADINISSTMAIPVESRLLDVLLVEDNNADVFLTESAFKECRVRNRLHIVIDGEAAIAFLKRSGPYGAAPRPDLVLLDLNLPKVDGFAVLAAMKADPELRTVPVVVLSGSDNDVDLARAYRMHVSSYVIKPPQPDEFIAAIRAMDLWFQTLALAPKEPEA